MPDSGFVSKLPRLNRSCISAWLNFFKKWLINLENDYMIDYMEFYCAKGGHTLA